MGAYILAVNAIIEQLGEAPKSIVFEGYKIGDRTGGVGDYMDVLSEIEDAPPSGACLAHQFQFKINGHKRMKAIVEGKEVKVIELPSRKSK